jgi:hypothetical protein
MGVSPRTISDLAILKYEFSFHFYELILNTISLEEQVRIIVAGTDPTSPGIQGRVVSSPYDMKPILHLPTGSAHKGKLLNEDKRSFLTKERVENLESMGFVWIFLDLVFICFLVMMLPSDLISRLYSLLSSACLSTGFPEVPTLSAWAQTLALCR